MFPFRVSREFIRPWGDCVFIAKQAAVVRPIRGRDAYEYDFLIEFNPAAIFRIPINSPPPSPPAGKISIGNSMVIYF